MYLQIYLQDYRSRAPASPAVTLETFFVIVRRSFRGRHQVFEVSASLGYAGAALG